MNIVDAIGIALDLKTENLESGLKRAQSSVSTFAVTVGSMLGNLFSGVLQELIGGISKAFSAMKQEVKALDDINKKTNASVEDISAWGFAVEESGGSAKAFQSTLLHLYNDLSRISITGRGRSKPFLEALGIDPTTLSSKDVFEVISDITKAVQGMDEQKSGYILKNLGFDPDTIKFIQTEGKNIDEVIAKQKEWGIYTSKDTEAIDKMDKAVKRSTNALKTLFIPTFSKILTIVAKGAGYISKAIIYFRKNTNMLRTAILLLSPAIVNLAKLFLATPIGKIVAGLASLVILFEDLWVYAKGGKTAFGDFWKHLGTPEEVMKGFEAAGRTIKRFFDFFGSLFDEKNGSKTLKFIVMIVGAIAALVAAIGAIPVAIGVAIALLIRYWEDIEKFFSDLKKRIDEYFGGEIQKLWSDAWQDIKGAFSNAIDSIKATWDEFTDSFSNPFGNFEFPSFDGVEDTWNSVSEAVSNTITSIEEKWDGFVEFVSNGWERIKSIFDFDIKLPELGSIKMPDFKLPEMPTFNLPKLPEFKIPDVSKIWNRIIDEVTEVWEKVSEIISEKVDFVKSKIEQVGEFLAGVWKGIKDGIGGVISEIESVVSGILSEIEGVISSVFALIEALINSAWEEMRSVLDEIAEAFSEAFDVVASVLKNTIDTIYNDVRAVADAVVGAMQGAFQFLVTAVSNLWNGLVGLIQSGLNAIADAWNSNMSLVQVALEVIAGLWNGFVALVQAELDTIASLWNGVVSAFESGSISIGSFLANAANTARRAWEGFITWLEQKWQWLKDLLPNFANIAEKLPTMGNNVQMAMAGGTGSVTNTTTTDNSVNNYTFNATTTQAADRFIEKSGYSAQMNTGVRR